MLANGVGMARWTVVIACEDVGSDDATGAATWDALSLLTVALSVVVEDSDIRWVEGNEDSSNLRPLKREHCQKTFIQYNPLA